MPKPFVDVKFSNNYENLKNEFPNLPKVAVKVFTAALKRDALRTMKDFKEGIKENSFGLKRLSDLTIKKKEREGLPKPTYPLYGVGDESKRQSYMNMLRIKEQKQGFVVYPSKEKHHSEKITLNRLWNVHEHGMIIKGRGGALIRIPPRPALRKALERAMRQRNMKETSGIIRTAIVLWIKYRDQSYLNKAQAYFLKGLEPYAVVGR